MFQLQSPTMNHHTFCSSLVLDWIFFLKSFFSMERSMLQYLLLYLFWGLMNSAISPWTLPIIFHATGAWPKEGRTWNTASSSCSKQKKKPNTKPGLNSSCKRRGTRVFCFPENLHFCFHFLLDLISAQNGQFGGFKPKQTPLFSRPQIPRLEMCFQISTTPAWLAVKETCKLGLSTKREPAFRFLPKPSDLTPFFFFFFFPFPFFLPRQFQAWGTKPWTFKLFTHQ